MNPEVTEVGVPLGVEQDISRFDIAVDELLVVHDIERLGDLRQPTRQAREWHRTPIAVAAENSVFEATARQIMPAELNG